MAKTYSGAYVIAVLIRDFGFHQASQKGSHVKLKKTIAGKTIVTIVPLHRELASGTLRGILSLANVEFGSFTKKS